jgi:hypothetical protein
MQPLPAAEEAAMGLWRWSVGLFSKAAPPKSADDDRHPSPEERRQLDVRAANAARAVESGIGAGPPSA